MTTETANLTAEAITAMTVKAMDIVPLPVFQDDGTVASVDAKSYHKKVTAVVAIAFEAASTVYNKATNGT